MKKFILIGFTVALAMVGMPLFAQGAPALPRLSMWNRGVFTLYDANGKTAVGPNWMGYTVDQGPYNSLSLDWAGTNVSWTMTADWEGDGATYPISLSDYSGSFRLFEGKAMITAGKVKSGDDYRFRNLETLGFATRMANQKMGVFLRVFPLKGLSLGAFLPVSVLEASAADTFSDVNIGAEYTLDKVGIIRAQYRSEEDNNGNRELATGVQITAVPNFKLTMGYTWLDKAERHDILMDMVYKFPRLELGAYGDLNLTPGVIDYGAKVSAEYTFRTPPVTLGSSASYGTGDRWWLDGLELYPYARYNLGGSSVQLGSKFSWKTDWFYEILFVYTIGF